MKDIFNGVYKYRGEFYTKNMDPGEKVYGEDTVKLDKLEYRYWDPNRSKLAAALKKGLKKLPLDKGSKVLYLGAAQGTTASHISDIVEENGIVYCVEFSERAVRDLLDVCERRVNMVPILSDARKPYEYEWIEKVDVIYQDVAQPDQIEIMKRNCSRFLKSGGWVMFAVKARAMDVTKEPKEIYKEIESELRESFGVVELMELDPFEGDHCFVLARKP